MLRTEKILKEVNTSIYYIVKEERFNSTQLLVCEENDDNCYRAVKPSACK